MPTLRHDLHDAIELRRWAWNALNQRPAPTPPASPRAWQLFLDRETCAVALARVPELEQPHQVRQRAQLESQQILLGRAGLAAVAAAIHAAGLQVIPLKGTDALLTPASALPLKDLDVLAAPGLTPSAEHALEQGGFNAATSRSYLHVVLSRPGTNTPVELHQTIWLQSGLTSTDLWTAAPATESIPGIRPLDRADHLWLCLVHVVAVHPDRAGRLRDLLLIRAAHAECNAAQLRIVSARMAAHAMATEFRLELEMALGGDTAVDRSRGDRIAATWYTLDALVARTPIGALLRSLLASWASVLATPSMRVTDVTRRLLSAGGSSRLRPVAALERSVPPLGRAIRVGIRLLWTVPVVALALPYAYRARQMAGAVVPD